MSGTNQNRNGNGRNPTYKLGGYQPIDKGYQPIGTKVSKPPNTGTSVQSPQNGSSAASKTTGNK